MKQPHGVILLVPSAREFDRGLRRGIVEYAHAHGPWIFHEEAPAYLQSLSPKQRLRNMGGWNAHGVIALQSRLAEVEPLKVPRVVAVETRRLGASICQVVSADLDIGRMGARTLTGLGLRHFAFCGLQGLQFSDDREAGFREGVKRAGYETVVYSSSRQNLGQSWYVELKQLARWLAGLPKPVGLMACNDDRARMVAEACQMRGIRVPDEVAILGVDNDEQVCRSASPPLSSIALATERGGYEAAALLASLMAGEKPPAKVVTVQPAHVVPRQSTDILAIEDPNMIRALRFVRENSNRNLRVTDLVAAAGISRRALQDRFIKELGRTPTEEMHRCRVDRIGRLLVETNMTIGEIAVACGFEVDAHVARFFSRRTGMTPLAYRKKMRIS
ncbi:MAG: helix-turn-helix domain-containing protein [Acidobacteria bacterium]|nr:helix-turn-helix domain-containing protein [Acidobacteriota bacterium]